MDRSEFESWFTKLGKAWSDRNPQAAASLFSKDCKYYESVFEESCDSWEGILKLWSVVPDNQESVDFDFDILCVSGDMCIANCKVSRTLLPNKEKQLIDGIFQIVINGQGLCNYFKQWRTVKKL